MFVYDFFFNKSNGYNLDADAYWICEKKNLFDQGVFKYKTT